MPDKEHEETLPARYPPYPQPQYPPAPTNISAYLDEEEDIIHLLDFWKVIVARRWTILAVLLTVVAATIIHTYNQVPMYRATVRLQIDRENPKIVTFQDVYAVETTSDDTLQTQYEILMARTLARRVIEDLRLMGHPEFEPAEPGVIDTYLQAVRNMFATASEPDVAPDETARLRGLIGAYVGRLRVTPVAGSRLVDVSFDATDVAFAASVINEHAEQFILQNLQFKVDATQDASSFLEGLGMTG